MDDSYSLAEFERHRRSRDLAIGALLLAMVTLAFFLLYWNRFLGMRMANGSVLAGQVMLEGKLPYRDFFFFAPPLHLLKSAGIVRLFGDQLIVFRTIALLERTLLALLVYFWLARSFRVPTAFLSSALAIIVSAGDVADPLSSYNHDTILWTVASGFCASIWWDHRGKRAGTVMAFLAGSSAGLAFSTKQTIGLGVSVVIPLVIQLAALQLDGLRKARAILPPFIAGWLVPVAAIWAWLFYSGVLPHYFDQLFISGPAAKGSFGMILVRPLLFTLAMPTLRRECLAAVGCLFCFIILDKVIGHPRKAGGGSRRRTYFYAAAAAASIVAAGVAQFHLGSEVPVIVSLPRITIYIALIGSAGLFLRYSLAFIDCDLSGEAVQHWLLSGGSLVVAFMLSISWPAFEAMVMPGLAYVSAVLLRRFERVKPVEAVLIGCCSLLIFSQTLAKLELPFGFDYVLDAPVRTANTSSKLHHLRGLLLPEATVRAVERIDSFIHAHSSQHQTIFAYPTFPLFYILSGRRWPTYAADHNTDVASDAVCKKDAAMLLAAKPAVLIIGAMPKDRLDVLEALWRKGNASGQRDLISAVTTLAREYPFHETVPVPGTVVTLELYAKH